jgi:signal transduction histidine kinase/HAMP domain-containing protein
MTHFRDLPIKRKLILITVFTSAITLLLGCVAFAVYQQAESRKSMARNFAVMADIFADNVASGLTFNDPASIEQTLRSMDAHEHVIAAGVYDRAGQLVARFEQSTPGRFQFPPSRTPAQQFLDDRLETVGDIVLAKERIGSVFIASDLRELDAQIWSYVATISGLLMVCSVLALILASGLQEIILRPIVDLARTATAIALDKNYALRAVKDGNDEVGRLVDAFNEMLAQIQEQDAQLQSSRDELELRVTERTKELREEVAERRQAEDALRAGNQRFEMVTRATTNVIWDWDLQTDVVWWNENMHVVFGTPDDRVETPSAFWKDRLHPEDAAQVLQGLQDALRGDSTRWTSEYRFRREDDTYADIFDRGYIIRGADGNPVRMIGAMEDVSMRKAAEVELARTHQKLLDASRREGMAEIATNVLHNVGNVLNSVNVSASLLADNVKKSKSAGLGKAVALLKEHEPDLGSFLSTSRGKQLLAYLAQLAAHLQGDDAVIAKELDGLRANVDHIKEIVAMQQSYAKVSGATEVVDLRELVEDSLRMNVNGLARDGVEVIREFSPVPKVTVDKHKVLQILVNLVQNARHATDESGRDDKKVLLKVFGDEGHVNVSVSDNGVGIPPENLTKIFRHGFTTKKSGHGFGLHSGALAVKEMGGRLIAQSEGPGKGATFTLELPIKREVPA